MIQAVKEKYRALTCMPGRYGMVGEIVGETGMGEREIVLLLRLRRTQSELDSARVPSFVYVVGCSCRCVDVVG